MEDCHGVSTLFAQKCPMSTNDPTKGVEVMLERIREPEEILTFEDLPTWARLMAAQHDLMGLSWEEAARRCGKKGQGSISFWNKTPAMKAWREEIKGVSLDPRAVVERIIGSSIAGVTMDYHAAYEKAVEVGDYKEVAKMSQDLLDRFGVVRKKDQPQGAVKIELTLGSGGALALNPPQVETSHEKITEADFEIIPTIKD